MMRKILAVLAVLIVLLLVATALLPAQTHVERSIVINASPVTVYRYISNFHEFNRWSPWAQRDPETHYEFSGPASGGVGAKMSWSSQNKQVGSGSQEITAAEPPHKLTVALQFGDDMGVASSNYMLEPQDGGTKVTWSFDCTSGFNPLHRFFGLMMDKWLGPDYEQGLANLKQLIETEAVVAIETKEINYEIGGVLFTGYLAYPVAEETKQYPGVLVVHEWWGLNDYARRRAQMLAETGYVALALDMYGNHKMAHNPDDAMKFMNEVTQDTNVAVSRFNTALELLKAQSQTDAERIAAIGYCFGGAVVLNMARAGAELDGVASFHGSLQPMIPEEQRVGIKAQLIVFNGAEDPFVSAKQREEFKAEMDAAQVDYEFINYPGAKHSFTVPEADALAAQFEMPLQYDAAADADSWQRLLAFFNQLFE